MLFHLADVSVVAVADVFGVDVAADVGPVSGVAFAAYTAPHCCSATGFYLADCYLVCGSGAASDDAGAEAAYALAVFDAVTHVGCFAEAVDAFYAGFADFSAFVVDEGGIAAELVAVELDVDVVRAVGGVELAVDVAAVALVAVDVAAV